MTTNISGAAFLDVTSDTCPMTFVRTRLVFERLPDAAYLRVRLSGAEPRDSVPRMPESQRHGMIERIVHEEPDILGITIRRGSKA